MLLRWAVVRAAMIIFNYIVGQQRQFCCQFYQSYQQHEGREPRVPLNRGPCQWNVASNMLKNSGGTRCQDLEIEKGIKNYNFCMRSCPNQIACHTLLCAISCPVPGTLVMKSCLA